MSMVALGPVGNLLAVTTNSNPRQRRNNRFAFLGCIALLAISIGVFTSCNFGLQNQATTAGRSPLDFPARIGIVCSASLLVASVVGMLFFISKVCKDRFSDLSLEKKIGGTLKIAALFTTLLAMSLLITSFALRHSSAYDDPRNSSFYGTNGWKEVVQNLTNCRIAGIVLLVVAGGAMAISLSPLPQRFARRWEVELEPAAIL